MYAFKPTPDVRSLGQLFGHIADANFMISAWRRVRSRTWRTSRRRRRRRPISTAALAASFKFCDAGFETLTAANANDTVKFFFPGTHTRLSVLTFNTAHDFEHYGNIATYMRLKGLGRRPRPARCKRLGRDRAALAWITMDQDRWRAPRGSCRGTAHGARALPWGSTGPRAARPRAPGLRQGFGHARRSLGFCSQAKAAVPRHPRARCQN